MVDARINQKAFQKAMKKAPENLFKELRKAWMKHHRDFIRRMKNRRLSGRPGLKAPTGTLRRGLIEKAEGTTANSLIVASVFAGAHGFFAHVHEGKTVTYTTKKGKSVTATYPPRLGFQRTFDRLIPNLVKTTNDAIHEALKPAKATT